ncbi:MAG: tRNA epoxyqueuosine(34) reductase QueG [Anaerolineae bacterium]|jgi:epoxyqueuosine reductase|nr:tRNA epoxyqueuosine(34) reductase QueG [Anaerolineae bacterium]MBT7191160.1 tRNA epoxyqueuosine(34) reductase QueG [Anaerolineae bacterium]MBT7990745.1 tRNA epoxyqueuosine(34) reductase QueG [Anaerolineae bacterium]
MHQYLVTKIKEEAKKQGFILAGITSPEAPPHINTYLDWVEAGRHASMGYLADDRARSRRADPNLILPEAESILVLAAPYPDPKLATVKPTQDTKKSKGQISAYAWHNDYHITLKEKLQNIVTFIENEVGHPISNRWYTDTGPILEKDLAQRAGLGWIGKNTCLINPKIGSYFFLAEIFLGIPLPLDEPFAADHCGTCTRCLDACPTQAILPNRTIDANLCISYLTIENKGEIPEELRPKLGDLIFGCDICQEVCPWNKKAVPERKAPLDLSKSEPVDEGQIKIDTHPTLISELSLTPQEFNKKFKNNPVKRAKRRGYLRNVAVALGNAGDSASIPALERALDDIEPLVRDHAKWALNEIKSKGE